MGRLHVTPVQFSVEGREWLAILISFDGLPFSFMVAVALSGGTAIQMRFPGW